jgi:hypothetical protein
MQEASQHGWVLEMHQQACEEARLAEAALHRATTHCDAMQAQASGVRGHQRATSQEARLMMSH